MYKSYYGFYEPENKDCKIWRYMDFTKFVDFLLNKQLYFCRADKFEDPFEGIFPTLKTSGSVIPNSQITRQFQFINCWHMNPVESAAMWSVYGESNKGIAIQTTYSKFKNSIEKLEEGLFLSIVKYHDYTDKDEFELMSENKWSPNSLGSTINPVIFKRKSFEYENELRAIYIDLPIEHDPEQIEKRNLPNGKRFKINPNELIEKIYISPKSNDLFSQIVTDLCKHFSTEMEVVKSDLYDRKMM